MSFEDHSFRQLFILCGHQRITGRDAKNTRGFGQRMRGMPVNTRVLMRHGCMGRFDGYAAIFSVGGFLTAGKAGALQHSMRGRFS